MGTILWDMAAAVVLGLDFVLEPVEKISQTPEINLTLMIHCASLLMVKVLTISILSNA